MSGREWARESGERYPRERIAPVVAALEDELRAHGIVGEVCGSWRRGAPDGKDLDVVVQHHARDALDILASVGMATVTRGGPAVANGVIHWDGGLTLPVDVWRAEGADLGGMLVFATGPGRLNIVMRTQAARKGLLLSQYGVFDKASKERLDDGTEEGVFAAVGWPFQTPEQRQARWAK